LGYSSKRQKIWLKFTTVDLKLLQYHIDPTFGLTHSPGALSSQLYGSCDYWASAWFWRSSFPSFWYLSGHPKCVACPDIDSPNIVLFSRTCIDFEEVDNNRSKTLETRTKNINQNKSEPSRMKLALVIKNVVVQWTSRCG